MKCPYCGSEMVEGDLLASIKTGLRFRSEADAQRNGLDRFLDSLCLKGSLKSKDSKSSKASLASYEIPAAYCKGCEKMILDVKI